MELAYIFFCTFSFLILSFLVSRVGGLNIFMKLFCIFMTVCNANFLILNTMTVQFMVLHLIFFGFFGIIWDKSDSANLVIKSLFLFAALSSFYVLLEKIS